MRNLRSNICSFFITLGVVLLVNVVPQVLQSAPKGNTPDERPKLSDSTISLVGEVPNLLAVKDYDKALSLIDTNLTKVEPESYDAAVTNLFGAQVCFTIGGDAQGEDAEKAYKRATPYMERALTKNYFDDAQYGRYVSSLANLYFSTGQKDAAEKTILKYIDNGKTVTPDMTNFMAILMIDTNRWSDALVWVNKLLESNVEPKLDAYFWAAACYQQLKDNEKAANYVERALQINPKRPDYWAQLVSMYYANLNPLGALDALERAQALGYMTTKRDYQTRAELYYNLEQYERAATIMRQGILDGKIANEKGNWMLISYCYQIQKEKEKQINALIEASEQGDWPEVDYLIANLYWADKNPKQTIKWIKSSLNKGTTARQSEVFILLISAAITENDFDLASWALEKVKAFKETETRIAQLERFISSSKFLYEEQQKEAESQ